MAKRKRKTKKAEPVVEEPKQWCVIILCCEELRQLDHHVVGPFDSEDAAYGYAAEVLMEHGGLLRSHTITNASNGVSFNDYTLHWSDGKRWGDRFETKREAVEEWADCLGMSSYFHVKPIIAAATIDDIF